MKTPSTNKGGRPAKKSIEKKQYVVSTKLAKPYFYAIQRRAKEAGISLSEYARQAILNGQIHPRLNRDDAEIIRKLAGEANNLNQLAKKANTTGFENVFMDLIYLKARIISIIDRLSDDWKNSKRQRI